jgi:hypothetical protein
MRLELLKAHPNLLNAHSKHGGSCSTYIMKNFFVALCAYMIKEQLTPYFECALSNFRDILIAHRATLGASIMLLEQYKKNTKLGISQ